MLYLGHILSIFVPKNSSINDAFIEEAFNFKPIDLSTKTISPILNINIKGYFEGDDNIESEICASSSYIILILHEISPSRFFDFSQFWKIL